MEDRFLKFHKINGIWQIYTKQTEYPEADLGP